jgi:hypothetical protein
MKNRTHALKVRGLEVRGEGLPGTARSATPPSSKIRTHTHSRKSDLIYAPRNHGYMFSRNVWICARSACTSPNGHRRGSSPRNCRGAHLRQPNRCISAETSANLIARLPMNLTSVQNSPVKIQIRSNWFGFLRHPAAFTLASFLPRGKIKSVLALWNSSKHASC